MDAKRAGDAPQLVIHDFAQFVSGAMFIELVEHKGNKRQIGGIALCFMQQPFDEGLRNGEARTGCRFGDDW